MEKFTDTSLGAIFQRQVKKYGDRVLLSYKKEGKFTDLSWNDMNNFIRNTSQFLFSQGIEKKDKIAIFSKNRYEWWIADQSIISIGAVTVPLYSTSTPEEVQYILENSDTRVCFVDTKETLEKVLKVKDKLPELIKIVIFNEKSQENDIVISMNEVLEKGKTFEDKSLFDERLKSINTDDVATIIYTSGTTGDPKGVMLTHNNLVSQMYQIHKDFGHVIDDQDIFISFLPLSHVMERMGGYYFVIMIGARTSFAEEITTIVEDIKTVRPTILMSVPRIYEKMHSGILAKISEASSIKKLLFKWASKVAAKNLPYSCKNLPRKGMLKFTYLLADKIIFSKLKAALGFDRLKFALSGGGALSVADAEFFIGMGFVIIEGYGLTETSPVAAANRFGDITPGSVGTPMDKTDIRISDDGEIQIKGPQLMIGYYKNEQATKEVMTSDGYFKTGDLGTYNENGKLIITGRIKDIIVTSGGKNVSPEKIETSIKLSKYIDQIALIGDNRQYISALVIPDFEILKIWALENNINFNNNADLINNDKTVKLIESEIKEKTKHFASYNHIKKFKIFDSMWSQETEELTPTQKVKRRVIEKKYADEIESLYIEN